MANRPRLSQSDYVAAAFTIADDVGLHALTLKALGERLGVDSTAVYRHFRSKDVLLLAMLDRLLDGKLDAAADHESPRTEIEHVAQVLREVLMAHPPLAVALAGVSEQSDTGARIGDRIVDAMARMGLEGDDLVVHYQLLEHVVVGACLFDGDDAPDDWERRRRGYERIGAREFRAVARSGASAQQVADAAFEAGVRLVLDACERRAG